MNDGMNPMTEPKEERLEKWEPTGEIATPAARALIVEDQGGLAVTLMFSEIVDGLHPDLHINFGRVPAYTVHEEFVHPWNDSQTEPPKLTGEWEGYTYPLLLVQDSEWVNSLTERLVSYEAPIHYRLVTLDQIVDVLCNKLPAANWAT